MTPLTLLSQLPLKLRNRHFLAADLLVFLVTPAAALALRTDELSVPQPALLWATLALAAVKLSVALKGGLYSRYWRYAGVEELAHIAKLGGLALLLQTFLFVFLLHPTGLIGDTFPRSVPVIEGILAFAAVGALRYSVRFADQSRRRNSSKHDSEGKRVVIAGAGSSGVMIADELRGNPDLEIVPVGFVDDDPVKRGAVIRGLPVLGRCDDIARIAEETRAREVIIAMPTASGKEIRRVVSVCEQAGLHAKTVPGMYELLGGRVSVKHLRDIDIEDLLRREPIKTDLAAVRELVRGKRVLVTGGGGSIGSEICRQVLGYEPDSLVILGHGENSVFEIHSELAMARGKGRPGTGATTLHPVIADIRALDQMRSVFEEYRPQVVFHSAAHKHVPLMELNPREAITNNVLGTRNLLDCSLQAEVESFVLISTDKAVNPTGLMGASKRVAELLVHQAAVLSERHYVAVRFGNVLGSRGSVVLTFRRQIAAGGPITITHEDMARFFMTIPEAVQLVLQASTLGRGGEVYMLDMGEPVRIVDLARDLVELSGLEVGRDIDIVFTGMRPGEKLVEELFIPGEAYAGTAHEKVFLVGNASNFVPSHLDADIRTLEAAARCNDRAAILSCLRRLVPEFRPVGHSVTGYGRQQEPLGSRPASAPGNGPAGRRVQASTAKAVTNLYIK